MLVVWLAGHGAQGKIKPTPVDLGVATLGKNALNDFGVENLSEVLFDEIESLLV